MEERRVVTWDEFWCRHEVLAPCAVFSVIAPAFVFGVRFSTRDTTDPYAAGVLTTMALLIHCATFAYAYTMIETWHWRWSRRYWALVVAPWPLAFVYHVIGFLGADPLYDMPPLRHYSIISFALGVLTVAFGAMMGITAGTALYAVGRWLRHMFTVPVDAPKDV